MTTTERIFELIKENNLTAKEFAFFCNLSQGNVTDWKTGRSKPSIEALKKISLAFNVNIDWLLGENSIKEKETIDEHLKFPNDFKYYVEDLPKCFIYKTKYIVYILLISNCDIVSIETSINIDIEVHRIPQKYKKDVKKAVVYLYNYNIQYLMNSNKCSVNAVKTTPEPSKHQSSSQFYMCPIYNQILFKEPYFIDDNIERSYYSRL